MRKSVAVALFALVVGGALAAPLASLADPRRPIPPRPRPIPQPGNPGHGHGRRLETPPARNSDPDERQVANMMAAAISGLDCDRAGEALRRLSNQLLASINFSTRPDPFPPSPGDLRGRLREEKRRQWVGHLRSPAFWQKVWERASDTYRGCELTCFDDGVAVGQISGAGYCAASVGVGGLTAPGFAYQPSLPLCQSAIYQGCQKGYGEAAGAYDGCSTYTSGEFSTIYKEYQSQDCHLDAGF